VTTPEPGAVLELAEHTLYAIACPYELDGRVSSHPVDARGWSTMLCYVFLEDDGAVLLNTGYSVHEEALVQRLHDLVGDRDLSLLIARVEFPSMCNARPIAARLRVTTVWQRVVADAASFLSFRPEFPGADNPLSSVETHVMTGNQVIPVGSRSGRKLDVFSPQLRLLPCSWVYDEATQTLFTGDLFGWVPRSSPEGPWVVDDVADDPTTHEIVEDHLLRNRYWWAAGANTEPLRQGLADLFDRFAVTAIAPDNGCVLKGVGVVAHQLSLLDAVLEQAARMPSRGLEAARWSLVGGA
jgi:hypothetical protein